MADADKTEKPTAKRLQKAKSEGQVAKTPELGTWLQVFVGTIVIEMVYRRATGVIDQLMLDIPRIAAEPSPELALTVFTGAIARSVIAVLPLAVAMTSLGMLASVAQTGLMLTPKAIKPKLSKVSPIQGFKRLVKPQGLWQGAKSLFKLVVIALVAWTPVFTIGDQIAAATAAGPLDITRMVVNACLALSRTVATIGLVLAAGDFAFNKWNNMKQLKMSKQEVKDEHKQSEGDPKIKGAIRSRMLEMSRNRMIAAVQDADVVVVNPTHVAVALKYQPGAGAPKVVAKGRGHIAARIREEALEHGVPLVRDVVLARTLESSVELDQPIPMELFEAVAHLLAFVMQVGRRASLLGGVLENPHAAPIPDELRDEVAAA